MLVSCGEQKAGWKGAIEEVDGVTVVKNPKEPMYGEDVFSLEEELSIGEAEGREKYMFSEIRGIAVDDEERIYVLDSKEAHIKIFDKDGEYFNTISRKGQGPGDIGSPRSVFITSQDEIVVPDIVNRQLAFFSLEGEFIKNISTAKTSLRSSRVDSKGNIIGVVAVIREENLWHELKKFDSDLNLLYTYAFSPAPSPSSFNPFMPVLRWELTQNDQVVCGYPEKYEIEIFNSKGKVIRKIVKDYKPVKVTKEEMERLEKLPQTIKVSILKYKSAYQRVVVGDEGKIFVMTWEQVTDGDGYYYDIFDSEGKYIAKIPLEFQPQAFKKSKLYTVEEDEEGYQYVKRYKVTWKY
jgi:hypothetical protein